MSAYRSVRRVSKGARIKQTPHYRRTTAMDVVYLIKFIVFLFIMALLIISAL
jgi:hypothetical protein